MDKERTQKGGKQKGWTIEQLSGGLQLFYKKYGHYPTSKEVDAFEFLPSSRSIQRRFGGMVELRKTLKLGGQDDYTKGAHSSLRAEKINKRAHEMEQEVYDFLIAGFGIEFVHREYFFTDDHRTRMDFFVYYKGGGFSVDVFYPEDRHNLIGCLNSKLKKYNDNLLLEYPVIFLQMNDSIKEEEIQNILDNKKNKLKKYQSLMCFNQFRQFCAPKKPNKIH